MKKIQNSTESSDQEIFEDDSLYRAYGRYDATVLHHTLNLAFGYLEKMVTDQNEGEFEPNNHRIKKAIEEVGWIMVYIDETFLRQLTVYPEIEIPPPPEILEGQ